MFVFTRIILLLCHFSLTAGSEKDEDGFYFKGNTSVPSYHKTEELQEPLESWDNGTLPNFFHLWS